MSTNGHLNGGAAAFDADEIRSEQTGEMPILHPGTGEPTTWVWTLAGPGHPKSIEQANKAAKESLRLDADREKAQVNRRKWAPEMRTPEQNRKENAESLATRVLGWTPVRINRADYPYSHENCVKLLLDPDFGKVYLQLLDYFTAENSFTVRSVTTSSDSPSATSD